MEQYLMDLISINNLTEKQRDELIALQELGALSKLFARAVIEGVTETDEMPSNYMLRMGMIPLGGIVSERQSLYPIIEVKKQEGLTDNEIVKAIFEMEKGKISPQAIAQVMRDFNENKDIFGIVRK